MLRGTKIQNNLIKVVRHFATKPKKDVSNAVYCAGSVKLV
jgi:hypothetical protein